MLTSTTARNPVDSRSCYQDLALLAMDPPVSPFLDHSFRSSAIFSAPFSASFSAHGAPAQRALSPPTGAQQIVPQVSNRAGNDAAFPGFLDSGTPFARNHPENVDELVSPGWVIPSKRFKSGPNEDCITDSAGGVALFVTEPLVPSLAGDGDRSVPSIDGESILEQPAQEPLTFVAPGAAGERVRVYRAHATAATESDEDSEDAEGSESDPPSEEQRRMWLFAEAALTADEEAEEGGDKVAEEVYRREFPSEDDDGMESDADCQQWSLNVDLTLQCTRGRLWGCTDVIGSIDFDASGGYFATGGISRKIRIYSLSSLHSLKEQKLEGWRARRSGVRRSCDIASALTASSAESAAGSAGDSEHFNYGYGLSHSGSRRGKRRAASTSDLRQYEAASRVDEEDEEERCMLDTDQSASKILCCAAKLSSVMWVPGSSGTIGAGDYDGVFAEWDIEKGLCVTEREEHDGQRIWSVDYSPWMGSNGKPMAASASDNGAVCLWSADSEDSIGKIRLASGNRAICTAKFGPARGGENLLVLAGADSKVYLYDLRNLEEPVLSLAGHQRTVSFVRFLGPGSLVSSSVDSTVKIWDVTGSNPGDCTPEGSIPPSWKPKAGASQVQAGATSSHVGSNTSRVSGGGVSNRLRASCDDHLNVRNFVGLSVRELDGASGFSRHRCSARGSGSGGGSPAGLIATGSENNELVIYNVDSGSRCSCACKFDFGFAKPTNHGNSSHPAAAGGSNPKGRSKSPMPSISRRETSSGGAGGGGGGGGGGNVFVSAVGWQQRAESDLLAAANSQGVVRILRAHCE